MTAKTRRVSRFAERAQTILDAQPWPEGFAVTVKDYGTKTYDAWFTGPGSAKAYLLLDPYDIQSVNLVRVLPELIRKFRAQGRDPRYTEQSRRDDLAAAKALEAVAADLAAVR